MASPTSYLSLWETTKNELRNIISKNDFDLWFANIEAVGFENDQTIVLETSTTIAEVWVNSNFSETLNRQLTLAAGRNMSFKLKTKLDSNQRQLDIPEEKTRLSRNPRAATPAERPAIIASNTFENFVVGPENQMAHAAALAVAKDPGQHFNPLFIYGPTGLGKTHLMHAIAHSVLESNPSAKILYIPSEVFVTEFITALQEHTTAQFKRKYREVDLLLIDDIQFIAGKESTQEEFFHAFNELHNNHKQVVLTSDHPASEIPKLSERLVSRFQWGMVADIQAPSLETRIAILKNKAKARKLELSSEILEFIASRIARNVRHLEGAVNRIAGFRGMSHSTSQLTMPQVEKLLHDILVEEASHTLTVEVIQRTVAEHYRIQMSDMTSHRRMQVIAFPRQVAMYITTQLTSMSLVSIGQAFGGRDHGTVIHARKTVTNYMEIDANVRRTVEFLLNKLSTNR